MYFRKSVSVVSSPHDGSPTRSSNRINRNTSPSPRHREAELSSIATSSALVSETIIDDIEGNTINSNNSNNNNSSPPSSPSVLQQVPGSHKKHQPMQTNTNTKTKTKSTSVQRTTLTLTQTSAKTTRKENRNKYKNSRDDTNDDERGVSRHSFSPDRLSEILSQATEETRGYIQGDTDVISDNMGIVGNCSSAVGSPTNSSISGSGGAAHTNNGNNSSNNVGTAPSSRPPTVPIHPAQYHAYMQHQNKMLKARLDKQKHKNKMLDREGSVSSLPNSPTSATVSTSASDDPYYYAQNRNSRQPIRQSQSTHNDDNNDDDNNNDATENTTTTNNNNNDTENANEDDNSQSSSLSNAFYNLSILTNTKKWLSDQKRKRQKEALEKAVQRQRQILLKEAFRARRRELAVVDSKEKEEGRDKSSFTNGNFGGGGLGGGYDRGLRDNPTFRSITSSGHHGNNDDGGYDVGGSDCDGVGTLSVIGGLNFCGGGSMQDEDVYYVDDDSDDVDSIVVGSEAGMTTEESDGHESESCLEKEGEGRRRSQEEDDVMVMVDPDGYPCTTKDNNNDQSTTTATTIMSDSKTTASVRPATVDGSTITTTERRRHLNKKRKPRPEQDDLFRIGNPHGTFSGQGIAVQLEIIEKIRPKIEDFEDVDVEDPEEEEGDDDIDDDEEQEEDEIEEEVELEENCDNSKSNKTSNNINEEDNEDIKLIIQEEENDIPFVLNSSQMRKIANNGLPASTLFSKWVRLYSLNRDGDSFEGSFLRKVGGHTRTLLVVQTTKHEIMAAYSNSPWEVHGGMTPQFYGSAQACLFSVVKKTGDVMVYKWSGTNRYIQFCDLHTKMLAFGGGGTEGEFGLCIENDFSTGSTGHCETFENDPLCSEDRFDILNVECWGFTTAFG